MTFSPALARSRRAFIVSGCALFVLIVGTNLPSPLYAVYAREFGFRPLVLTLIFATYAGTLVPALLLTGAAADTWGYRRVVLPGLAAALAAALVFAFADAIGWLFVARALQGAAVGASSGALTAALVRTEPNGDTSRASLLTSLATTGGGGVGPVVAGACGTWLPGPTRTCYLVEAGALVTAAAGLLALPAALGRTAMPWRASRPRVPAAVRPQFAMACTVSFTGWAVTAVFLSIVPTYVASLTGNTSLLLAGASSGLVLVIAAVGQPLANRLTARRLQDSGLLVLAAGLAVLMVAGATARLVLVLGAAVIAGIGQGLAFMGAVRRANQITPSQARAAVMSAFYVATYLGVGLPVVGVGLLANATSTKTAVDTFAIVALLGSLLVVALRVVGRQSFGKQR